MAASADEAVEAVEAVDATLKKNLIELNAMTEAMTPPTYIGRRKL